MTVNIFSMSISDTKAKYRVITEVSFEAWFVTQKSVSLKFTSKTHPNPYIHLATLTEKREQISEIGGANVCVKLVRLASIWGADAFPSHISRYKWHYGNDSVFCFNIRYWHGEDDDEVDEENIEWKCNQMLIPYQKYSGFISSPPPSKIIFCIN